MKRMLVVLLVAFYIFGCTSGPQMKDCGTDSACFEEAAKTCSPAKVKSVEEGMEVEGTLKGIEGNNCIISLKIVKSSTVTILEGKEMTCKVPKDAMAEKSTDFEGIDPDACTGSLVDLLKSMGAQ
ncbi:MAG: hypothetical protein ABII22_01760 [Candidatus Micrarchaeota archaeon]